MSWSEAQIGTAPGELQLEAHPVLFLYDRQPADIAYHPEPHVDAMPYLFLPDDRPERRKRQSRQLKALLSERDSDDGHTPQDTDKKKRNSQYKSAKNQPNDISKRMPSKIRVDISAKGPKHQPCQLEALGTERDADNGQAPQHTEQTVAQPHFET